MQEINDYDRKLILATIKEERKLEEQTAEFLLEKLKEERQLREEIGPKHLIAIHMTNYFPHGGIITTTGMHEIELEGMRINYPRETIHFALNGIVAGNLGGSGWEHSGFAILIPVESIFKRIECLKAEDTFIVGSLELPEGSEVLVPEPLIPELLEKGEVVMPNENEPNKLFCGRAVVLVYNEGMLPAAILDRIRSRGFTPMKMSDHSWTRPETREEAEAVLIAAKTWTLEDVYDGSHWTNVFTAFATQYGKIVTSHEQSFWGTLENIANICVSIVHQNQDMAADVCAQVQKKIPEILDQLSKRRDSVAVTKEEKEAYERITQILLKWQVALREKSSLVKQ